MILLYDCAAWDIHTLPTVLGCLAGRLYLPSQDVPNDTHLPKYPNPDFINHQHFMRRQCGLLSLIALATAESAEECNLTRSYVHTDRAAKALKASLPAGVAVQDLELPAFAAPGATTPASAAPGATSSARAKTPRLARYGASRPETAAMISILVRWL